jgi:hypothetical protein
MRRLNLEPAGLEVDVLPFLPERFSNAKAGRSEQHPERMPPGSTAGREQVRELASRQRRHLVLPGPGNGQQLGRIRFDEALM